jgi:NitT/TauT family transport system ATP-binding protein
MVQIIIEGVDFSYRFPKKEILKNVNLIVERGEIVALMGTSGFGKTTLLKLISNLIKPTRGKISLTPRNDNIKTKLAYLTQDANKMIFPWMSVESNLYYPLRLRNELTDQNKSYCKSLYEKLELDSKLLKSFPNKISGGERKRLSIAMALSYQPDIILLDEPLTGLDFALTQKLWDFLYTDFTERNPTVLMITHNLDEAIVLAHRILIIHYLDAYEHKESKTITELPLGINNYFSNTSTPRSNLLFEPEVMEYKKYVLENFNKMVK